MEVNDAVSSRSLGVCSYLLACGYKWLATDARDGTVWFIWPAEAKGAIQHYYATDPEVSVRAVLRARAILHQEMQRVLNYKMERVTR